MSSLQKLTAVSLLIAGNLWLASTAGWGKNLIVNGNFEAGNTGFSSEYAFVDGQLCAVNGQYTIATDPGNVDCGGVWADIGDHTSGTGQMLIADAATSSGTAVWSQTIAVRPHSKYTFAFWGTTTLQSDFGNPPSIQVLVNGLPVGNPLHLPNFYDGKWHKRSLRWRSGSHTNVTISLVDLDTESSANDFALDDIALKRVRR